ncbi:MAG: leucine--tRNA ligase [Xanthomonadales bacterium]|nr:leucine--tRNA ligase [Gammaproteobacteria bacterium]MBT8054500.1 leucine--tRNA ligase [Gammaproteobacteria bacterium]NND57715.1 leucine--tRNA ligase [Xanthomonadales bacterium]NNK52614.1 leucine--tRNA ligase [Xanthomonadales bacterium]
MATTPYNPGEIEPEIQQQWERDHVFRVTEDPEKEKFYCLSMLPYPSGALHMGHVRNYTIGDVISRYHRMCGRNVLQPMGWDAFGLPAENAAIRNNTAPAIWTYANIENMREKFKRLGFAYDWSREVTTCKPDYYRWEQQMFTRLMRKGLAYRKDSEVNWDPVDQTVLANEQVVDGKGWRSGAVVERKSIPQWFLKITDFAEELLLGLDDLEGWPDAVKTMQRNWIGRSEGAEFEMKLCSGDGEFDPQDRGVRVFTTRPDTSFGMTYAVLAPEHPLVAEITTAECAEAVAVFVEQAGRATEEDRLAVGGGLEKRGVFTGAYLYNPFTRKPVPLYLADYVLMGYGTGAIMAVPGQDQRDWDFAVSHGLPIIRTVATPEGWEGEAYTQEGPAINSEWLNGMDVAEAKEKAICWLEAEGLGERKVNYRLRDWGVSRQRYWGCPIPVIYCKSCGAVPVPEDQLPVVLPEDVSFMGVQSPIKADPEWRKTTCPECGEPAERETDTFDTFMESSWYYARYCCPDADSQLDERARYWLPVDQYIGGIEHAILHLMYFRFYHKLMRDAGMVDSDEPATRLLCQGMVVADTYYREEADGRIHWINASEIDVDRDSKGRPTGATLHDDGLPVEFGGTEKMSKSKNNGVDPERLMDRYGADTVRLFSVSDSPPHQSLEWSDSGVEGASRFLRRVWSQVMNHVDGGPCEELEPAALDNRQKEMRRLLHDTIAKVGDDISRRYTFNTAIAAVMELTNHLAKFKTADGQSRAVVQEAWANIVRLMAPITPHICEQLWGLLGGQGPVCEAEWPVADEAARERTQVTLVVQINGKLRARLELEPGATQEQAMEQAMAIENVHRHIDGKAVRKVIHIPDRLLNIVVG